MGKMQFQEIIKKALAVRSEYAKANKKEYGQSWSREQIMQGFVGDVGDLSKLVLAKEGVRAIEDVDTKLKHELADCLWAILVLADEYDVDMEKEFMQTMDELEKRLAKKV